METILNPGTAPLSTHERFEPHGQFAWGQMVILATMGSVGMAVMDWFTFPQARSLARYGCVCGGVFVGMLALYWWRSARNGYQTVVVDEESLTVETMTRRRVLPWDELVEVTVVGDAVLKLKSRKAGESLRLENHGFTQQQWNSIKGALKVRGYEFKIG